MRKKQGSLKEEKSSKILSIAALTGSIFLGTSINSAFADGLSVDIPATSTLDILPNASDIISTYNLAPTPNKDASTVTLYNYVDGEFVEQNYNVNLKNNVYGEGNNTLQYTFSQDADNTLKLEQAMAPVPASNPAIITINYAPNNDVVSTGARGWSNYGSTEDTEELHKNFYNNGIEGAFEATIRGGAVYNAKTINDLNGNYIGNYIIYEGPYATQGGAVFNGGTIDKLGGNFIGNSISTNSYGDGGAVYNYLNSNIGEINAHFIANRVDAPLNFARGGAIANYGEIKNITGDFIGNTASSSLYRAYGGAIFNYKKIGNITGDFIGNTVISTGYDENEKTHAGHRTEGGAIHNWAGAEIGNITGNFYNNAAINKGKDAAFGGAIFNNYGSKIGDITGNFAGNYIDSSTYYADGAAIYNYDSSTIGNITGNFYNNSITASGKYARGAAIYNEQGAFGSSIGDVKGTFIGNSVEGTGSETEAYGGAIYNDGVLGATQDGGIINSSFYNNYAKSTEQTAQGGAIWTAEDLNIVAKDGATVVFDGNYVEDKDGKRNEAIYVSNKLPLNYAQQEGEYYVYNDYPAETTLTLNAKNNGTIILNDMINGETRIVDQDVTSYYNTTQDKGRVDYLQTTQCTYYDPTTNRYLGYKNEAKNLITGEVKVTYYDSSYKQQDSLDLPENVTERFSSPYTDKANCSEEINIYYDVDGNIIVKEITTTYSATNTKFSTVEYYDADDNKISELPENIKQHVETELRYNVAIDGDISGRVFLNNSIIGGADVSLSNTNLYLSRENFLDGNYLALNSGLLSMVNNQVGISQPASLTVNGNTNFIADVDLKNKVMDRFVTDTYGEHTGNLNVAGMNLLSDADPKEKVTAVYFAQPGLKYNVTNGVSGGTGNLPDNNQTTYYTPIYKYTVTYDNQNEYDGKGDGGYFLFSRGGSSPSDEFNPAVLAGPVAGVAASQSTINETFKYVFEHADAFTQLPQMERLSFIESNKYALSTDFNDNLLQNYNKGSLDYDTYNKALWVRPYTSLEDVNIKRGPAVDAINYGTLIGYDGDFTEMRHGWHRLGTTYIGYNGSQLDYEGNSTTLNGGLIGGTETYYKGNFWTAITASAGVSVGETHNMYGKEDFTNLLAGVASKTGYNFEFKEGKFIIQPIMFVSYTFVDTLNFKNAAGVKIKSDPSHSIQIHPNIRFIANCKNGWQPYAQFGAIWNVYNKSHVTADGVVLPSMTSMPYVEYGAGIQRNWRDSFTAFAQTMIRNGGRTGIAFTAGFRWALGKDEETQEQVKVPELKKESIVSAVNAHDIVTGAATPTNNTALVNHTVIKQLKR